MSSRLTEPEQGMSRWPRDDDDPHDLTVIPHFIVSHVQLSERCFEVIVCHKTQACVLWY